MGETFCQKRGGSGARAGKTGSNGVHVRLTNTSNLPVEALEVEFPLTEPAAVTLSSRRKDEAELARICVIRCRPPRPR